MYSGFVCIMYNYVHSITSPYFVFSGPFDSFGLGTETKRKKDGYKAENSASGLGLGI